MTRTKADFKWNIRELEKKIERLARELRKTEAKRDLVQRDLDRARQDLQDYIAQNQGGQGGGQGNQNLNQLQTRVDGLQARFDELQNQVYDEINAVEDNQQVLKGKKIELAEWKVQQEKGMETEREAIKADKAEKNKKADLSIYKDLDFWNWLPSISYLVAALLNTFAAASIPLTPAPYTYICQVDFGPEVFNGTVNGLSVVGLESIRLGNWAGCFYDLTESAVCLKFTVAYSVTITKDNSPEIIVQGWWTAIVSSIQVLAALPTIAAIFYGAEYYWVDMIAVALSAVAILGNVLFYVLVKHTASQSFGELAVTKLGPVIGIVSVAIIFIISGALLRRHFTDRDYRMQEEREGKANADNDNMIAVEFGL